MTVGADPTALAWVIVGYGRVGQSLALLADQLDCTVAATWNRTARAARSAAVESPAPHFGTLPQALGSQLSEPRLIWLTVVDEAIEEVFASLVEEIASGSVVVHTSGSQSSAVLDGSSRISTASLHPLQAIADPIEAVEQFRDTYWTIEGDRRAVDLLSTLLARADINPVHLAAEHKLLYHASAVTAANLLVSLIDAAIRIAEAADIDADEARRILVGLARSSLSNLSEHSPRAALTGPVARGDLSVIEQHRRALSELDDPSLLEIYDLLTNRALSGLSD